MRILVGVSAARTPAKGARAAAVRKERRFMGSLKNVPGKTPVDMPIFSIHFWDGERREAAPSRPAGQRQHPMGTPVCTLQRYEGMGVLE